MCLDVEDGSCSVAGSADACSAFKKEEEEHVQLHELVEEGAEIGMKEHEDNDDAGCGGGREQGVRTSSAGDGDRDRDGINYYDLRSLLAKIELRICPDFRSSATRVFWDYATLIFGLPRQG